jgi:hypothetical protein
VSAHQHGVTGEQQFRLDSVAGVVVDVVGGPVLRVLDNTVESDIGRVDDLAQGVPSDGGWLYE